MYNGFQIIEDDDGYTGYECPVDHEGNKIFVRAWLVKRAHKQPVLLCHDLGEHTRLYEKAALAFNDLGFDVFAFDMCGHGKSGAKRGHIPSFKVLISDMLQVVSSLKFRYGNRAPVIVSQGLGSLVTLALSRTYPNFVAGAVFVSPMFRLEDQLSNTRRIVVKLLADVFPEMTLPGWLSPRFTQNRLVSIDEKEKWLQPKITANFAIEVGNAVNQSRRLITRLSVPALFVLPSKSKILKFEFIKKVLSKHSAEKPHQVLTIDTNKHGLLSDAKEEIHTVSKFIGPWMMETFQKEHQPEESPEASPLDVSQTAHDHEETPVSS